MTTENVASPPREERGGLASRRSAASFFEQWSLVGALLILTTICMIALPQFRTSALLVTMINAQALIVLLALLATMTLRVGDFDLSIAQMMVVSAATLAQLSAHDISPGVAVACALALGLAVGALNSLLVVKVGVDSFIATLGSFTALSGLAYLITDGRVIASVPDVFTSVSRAQLFTIPLITWYGWIFVLVLWYVYERTPLGRYMLFIGGNRQAARLAGISVNRIRVGTYLLSGLGAAAIGILFAGYFGAVDPSVGNQFMLQPFAAAYLGATAISVGRFNAFGTLVAVYLLTVGITALQLLGAETWVTNLFYGVALMGAVAAARIAGGRGQAST